MVVLVLKNLPAKAGDLGGVGLITVYRRSSGGGHGNAFQYGCLENPHGQSQTELKGLCMHACKEQKHSSSIVLPYAKHTVGICCMRQGAQTWGSMTT